MKKLIVYIIIALSVLSCKKDFLERYPTTSLVTEKFYQTPTDGDAALTAAYNMLQRDDYWCSLITSEMASDECTGGSGTGDGGGFQRIDRGIQSPDANVNINPWNVYYGGVFRANIYLAKEGLIDWKGNTSLQKQYQAEAKFLRAYMHFYMARLFGEIPFLDHPLSPGELPGRTPAKELYSKIIDDLKFCAENGLSAPYPGNIENWGRATKWAAEALIGRVYLYYSGYYNDPELNGLTEADARAYVDDVIKYGGFSLVPEYASLWRVSTYSELGGGKSIAAYAGEINPEVIWSTRWDGANNAAMPFARMIGPRNTNVDPYGQGWGAMPVVPSLWNLYDTTDKRRTATILSWDHEGKVYVWNSAANSQAQYTGYNCKKYELACVNRVPEARPDWQLNGSEDYIVIRYADVLLMAAEFHVLNGDNGTALNYVNQVRERAFGNSDHNLSSVNIDDIFAERKLELACEGLRYWDILRSCKGDFSKLVPILTYVDNDDGGDFSQTIEMQSLDVDGNNFVERKGLFQIPPDELELMKGVIVQNPGYTSN